MPVLRFALLDRGLGSRAIGGLRPFNRTGTSPGKRPDLIIAVRRFELGCHQLGVGDPGPVKAETSRREL